MEVTQENKLDMNKWMQKLEEWARSLFDDIIFILVALIEHDNRLDLEPERIQDLPKY